MTALTVLNDFVEESANTVSGATRVVTSPLASNRSTPDEFGKFVKDRIGTLFDGLLVVPSTTVIYLLYSSREQGSLPWRIGKGVGYGSFVFLISMILRRVVL